MEEKYKILIHKYLSGKLNEAEVVEFIEWLKLDLSNRAVLDDFKKDWLVEEGSDEELDKATNELFYKLNLNTSLNKNITKKEKPVRKLFPQLLKVAAVFLFGIVCTMAMQEFVISPKHSDNVLCTVNADRGQKSRMTLPDGTDIWLNAESKIRFSPEEFHANRVVELEGEAYFKVKRNEKLPFIVKAKDYEVKVLGTEFNVMAYEDMGRTETILVKGKVEIIKGLQIIEMHPGEKVSYEANQLVVGKADLEYAKNWRNNELRFVSVPFNEVMLRLERWYDVDIEIADVELFDESFTGVFRNEESITQILEGLKVTSSISYKSTGFKKYVISSN